MTIKDLAAKTGYAVGTVSRALNNHPNVSERARQEILEAAAESGFQLNVNAKQLKQHHSTTILVVVKGIGNEDFGGIDVPCVVGTNDASMLSFDNLSSVSTDDREAACSAMDTLIHLGHSRIAIIGGDRAISDTSRLRYEGCMQSFTAHGIPFDPKRDYQGVRYSYQAGYQATKALLDKGCRFTAIFATADVMAIGAIRALQDNGLQVPEDVSVMGVDGLPLSSFLVPRLATVRQTVSLLAKRSVEILLGNIERNAPACHETVPFEILSRESIREISH